MSMMSLISVNMSPFQVQVFWIVTSCNIVTGHQCFRFPCCKVLWNVNILPQHYEPG